MSGEDSAVNKLGPKSLQKTADERSESFIDDGECRVPSGDKPEEVALASEGGVNTVPVMNRYKVQNW